MENFANGRQVGVEPAPSRMPISPELPADIPETLQRGTHLVPTFATRMLFCKRYCSTIGLCIMSGKIPKTIRP